MRKRPLVVEFSGVPKAGKTTVIKSLSLFLRRNKIPNIVIQERASVCPIKNKESPEFNIWTGCTALTNILQYKQSKDYYVILVDRGIYDTIIWLKLLNKREKLNTKDLEIFNSFFLIERWKKILDLIIFMHVDIEKSLEREYKDLLTNLEGSIMNKDFLADYISTSEFVNKEYASQFRKFLYMDTTKTGTLEGVAKVTKEVIKGLKELSDEEIFLINKSDLKNLLNSSSKFSESKNDLNKIQNVFTNKSYTFMSRSKAEDDSSFLQIIVCSYITHRDSIMVFRKKEIDKNNRLHNKQVIWIGGHLQKKDLESNTKIHDIFYKCLKREIHEEITLDLDDKFKPEYKGMVYDKSHTKSLLHLGIVYHIKLKDDFNISNLDNKTFKELSGQEIDIELIPLKSELFQAKIESIEPWSSNILNSIFKIIIPVPKDRKQMVLF